MRALVLFAGAGGACVGLRDAGVEHALGVEWDESAAETSRAAGFPTVTGDVRDLSIYADVGQVDLLWSSFPCQDFSTAGTRKGAKGDRNGWPWTVDVIDHVGPRWFIGENVTGLTMHVGECPTRDGREQDDPEACPRCYLDGVIMPQLRARYAWAEWRILDAADYGVPQRRRRVIIAAGPRAIDWPAATHSGEALAVAKWVTGEYWRGVGVGPVGLPSNQEARWLAERSQVGLFSTEPPRFGLKPWRTVRHALGLGGNLEASRNTDANPTQERSITTDEPIFAVEGKGNQYLTRVLGGGHNPNHGGDEVRNLRDITDEPSTTVAAQTGGGAGNAGPFVERFYNGQRTAQSPRPGAGPDGKRPPGRMVERSHTVDLPADTVTAAVPSVETRAGAEPGRLDMPAPTVAAGSEQSNSPNGRSIVSANQATREGLLDAMGRRRLTVAECATLQDFPPRYPFRGTKTSQYRQIGNAVPPMLARVVAEAITRSNA